MTKIEPPWDLATVEALNAYQEAGRMHPFTCPNRGDESHAENEYDGELLATEDGWLCQSCDYSQTWAWEFMADSEWSAS